MRIVVIDESSQTSPFSYFHAPPMSQSKTVSVTPVAGSYVRVRLPPEPGRSISISGIGGSKGGSRGRMIASVGLAGRSGKSSDEAPLRMPSVTGTGDGQAHGQ